MNPSVSVGHCIRAAQELVSRDVRFLSATDGLDSASDSPTSLFLLRTFAPLPKWSGTSSGSGPGGVRAAKAKGAPLGRSERIFRREEAQRLRAQDVNWRKIAKSGLVGIVKLGDRIDDRQYSEAIENWLMIVARQSKSSR